MATTVTKRPNGIRLQSSDWRDQDNNTFPDHNEVNDANDGTYVWCIGVDGTQIAFYDTHSLASNQRVASARLWVREGSFSDGFQHNADYWIRYEGQAGDGAGINVNNSNNWTTYNALYDAEITSSMLFQQQVWCRYNGGVTTVKIADVWIDLDVRTLPIASITGPSGGNQPLKPTVTWTNNFQGDTARAYQVVITDTNGNWVFDSTRQGGSATSYQITSNLAQGTTYWAYVRIATDFRGGDWWSEWSGPLSFTTHINNASMPGTSGMTASGFVTSLASSSMPGVGSMTDTAIVIVQASATMPSELSDLTATVKKSTCATCKASCNCFIAEDGFFSDTLDFDGRNFSTVEGNGSVESPYVIHFMDQDLFRPKTAEIIFSNATLAHGTTSTDVRLISGIADTGAMNYQSPIRFIIRDYMTGQPMFAQLNYFLVGATVTFAEAADSQSNIRRITLATYVDDPAIGAQETEVIVGGHSTPGGGGDPLTLSCQAFVPGLFAPLSTLSTRVTPFMLYLTQTSGGPIAVSNIKVWVTQI